MEQLKEQNIIIWVDAQLSPAIAKWLQEDFHIKAASMRALGLLTADDEVIFNQAKENNVILLTKDIDLVKLQERFGQPPKIIHLTCGNTASKEVRKILQKHFSFIIDALINKNEAVIEITD